MTRVLHILPHPGGGAETYIDLLEEMDGFEHERMALSVRRTAVAAGPSIMMRWPAVAARARSADIIHAHGDVAASLSVPLLRNHPSVATTHGLHFLRRATGERARVARLALRAVASASDRLVCTSLTERDELLAFVNPRFADRLVVVTNGIPLPTLVDPAERAAIRAELDIREHEIVGLYLGRLEERKDPLTAIRATWRARSEGLPVVLLVAGDGPLAAAIVAQKGTGVRVLGFRSDPHRLLAAADVFVMPSEREGLSFAVLEAMGHGLPMVVSDGAGNPEAVGETGLIAPVGDVAAFAELLGTLAADPAARAHLGQASRQRVADGFGVHHLVDGMRDVYESVLAGHDGVTVAPT